MKKIEVIIRPEKLESLKHVLSDFGISGMMISNIMGFGNQGGHTQMYRGTKYLVNFIPKIRVETVVKKDDVDEIVETICKTLSTGAVGDGKIFIYPVEEAIRIRTGEKGEEAL